MSIFDEVLGFQVDSVLSKSIGTDMMELAVSPASEADGHHGGGEMGGLELDEKKDITRVAKGDMSTADMKEPSMSSGIPQKLHGKTFDMPAPVSEMHGWPGKDFESATSGERDVMLSEDDVVVGQQMHGKKRPVEASASVGHGDETRTDDSLGSNRRMLKGFGMSQDVQFVARQPMAMRQLPAMPEGRSWQAGAVSYSTSLDERIAKSIENDTLIPEPTLNWQAPLLKSHVCGNDLCKSSFPSFLTVCPNCHAGQGYHGVSLSKSVESSVRGPTQGDLIFPANGIKLG